MGSLDYVGVLGDFRRYFMPVRPFTLAARLLHYGRYGNGGEDPRLQPLFLGYPGLVRGYSFGSFDASECNPGPGEDPNSCPVFDQLLGSRMVVGNAELRFPLFGVLGIGSGYYGAFPIEFAIFGDGGLAWDTHHNPSVFGSGSRDPVFSAGAGLRINLLGSPLRRSTWCGPSTGRERGGSGSSSSSRGSRAVRRKGEAVR